MVTASERLGTVLVITSRVFSFSVIGYPIAISQSGNQGVDLAPLIHSFPRIFSGRQFCLHHPSRLKRG
jgi:hypothetical protein